MNEIDKYLVLRKGNNYYFQRTVPTKVREFDGRKMILATLKTQDVNLARKKRDEMVALTDGYWNSLLSEGGNTGNKLDFETAMERAKLLRVDYIQAQDLATKATINELVTRISQLETNSIPENHIDTHTLLGVPDRPKNTISEVFKVYVDNIAIQDQENKTKDQIRVWKKAKSRAIDNFIKLTGDLPIDTITRRHATNFFDWWMQRITGQSGQPMAPGTAQKDIGNLKKIYTEYYSYYGDEDRLNPFRNLRFKNIDINKRPAFSLTNIQNIYQSLNIQNLNFEARMLMFICADTGCRPSEICGLEKSNIHLNEEYPYIEIKDMPGRKLKTRSSNRTIPLIGVALEAMKQIPDGAERYKFKETQLSATINKFLRSNKFLPTAGHSFYSFRHAIMDRMEEANIEDEFRRRILGHSINKPNYGDGGNMKFRHEKMKKIEIGFNPLVFTNLD